jgi:hypothetical protein
MLEDVSVKELKDSVRQNNKNEKVVIDINTYIEEVYRLNSEIEYEDDFVQLIVDLYLSEEHNLSDLESRSNKQQIFIWKNGVRDFIEDPSGTCIDINNKSNRK